MPGGASPPACVVALAVVVVLVAASAASAQPPPPGGGFTFCPGEVEADDVAPDRGKLRFGITPLVQTGQVGPSPAEPVPERPRLTHEALGELRPREGPFVLRLNRFFWSDRSAGIERYERLAKRFTRRGYRVELQLRYHPDERQEGDIAAWKRFVRKVVRRFGPNRRVVAIQVTNEVNVTFSPDSSDGAYEGARDALVRGVIAAKDEARSRGFKQLEIGFNWFSRTSPQDDERFWERIREGGRPFVRSLDWIGLDTYPGTFFPPVEAPGEERDGMVNAMSALRCFARSAGIPDEVPMHVEENGWPTPPGRSYERQRQALKTMVRAVCDYQGTYNVTDYRWFNLRDAETGSPNLAQNYGLLEDDYDEKPAFDAYRGRIRACGVGQASGRRCAGADGRDGDAGSGALGGRGGRCGAGGKARTTVR